MTDLKELLNEVSAEFARLRPQSIRPAEGFIKHDYLIPAGFYKQMWDWDGFFIGCHLAHRSREEAEYLKGWALNFVELIDEEGYVTGCITTTGPNPLFGKFAMKPFLAQGAYFASLRLEDFSWITGIYKDLERVIQYREKTEFDERHGLFAWDIAIQSGADNNVVLTNDENDRNAVEAADASTFQLREYIAMAKIAERIGRELEAGLYAQKARALQDAMLEHLWFAEDSSFFNIRRDTGAPLKRISYSNFLPLIQNLLPREEGRGMIEAYLWNEGHMLGPYGLRSLSKQDKDYNNENMIKPYSNWQGPVWPVANYLYSIALKNYGFEREAAELARRLGTLALGDIRACGSMHENYHADTGAPLAPTAEQTPGGVFTGFVGWNLTVENILEGVVEDRWMLLELVL
jgi:alpha,alpha-trehalase